MLSNRGQDMTEDMPGLCLVDAIEKGPGMERLAFEAAVGIIVSDAVPRTCLTSGSGNGITVK
jgi:hypothetical protein